MKNKLFSVLAHDLRNSLGSFVGIIDALTNEYDEFSEEEKANKLQLINNTSREVYDLLESILEWQITLSKSPEIHLQRNDFYRLCDEAAVLHMFAAQKKQIKIINEVQKNSMALFNEKLSSSILRHLMSNAIKFSHPNGVVRIISDVINKNGKDYLTISIEDKGIGIRQQKIDDFYASSPGFYNEAGNSLGLVLCKEFVEMQGGELNIESEEEVGSTFSFSMQI